MADWTHIKEELAGAWPPGVDQVLDFRADKSTLGAIVEALAKTLADRAAGPVEALRAELSPLTASALGIADWEENVGLAASELGRTGTTEQRRAQLLSRLREQGPPTLEEVRAVLAPLAGYTPIQIVRVSRTALRTAHTRTWSGLKSINSGTTAEVTFDVRDDAAVSASGAQIDLYFGAALPLVNVVAELTGPDATTYTWIAAGGTDEDRIRLYAPSFAGKQIMGTWTLRATLATGLGSLIQADLFVEGFGRDSKGFNGLGSAIFEWYPVLQWDLLAGATTDPWQAYRAWLAAMQRIAYAMGNEGVAMWPKGLLGVPADIEMVVDDDHAIVDAAVVG